MTTLSPIDQKSYFKEIEARKSAAAFNDSTIKRIRKSLVDSQIGGSIALLSVIFAHDIIITRGASPFIHLKHQIPNDEQGRYRRGFDDIFFILNWVIVFTLIRAVVMYKILEPFAKWYGVNTERKITRFAEQGWLTIYYTVSSIAGLYVMSKGPHWMDMQYYWVGYPDDHSKLSALMKSYYLIQMGFWFQQIYVLLIEEPRKDFVVMATHHVVTCNLLSWSLYMNFTRVGNAILCCMDFADIFLSGTKCLRYLDFEGVAVFSFITFIVSWIYTRHYLLVKIICNIIFDSIRILPHDNWNPSIGSFYTRKVILRFAALLIILELLIIYWFILVLRIIYRIIFQHNLDDSRSDSESDADENVAPCEDKKRK